MNVFVKVFVLYMKLSKKISFWNKFKSKDSLNLSHKRYGRLHIHGSYALLYSDFSSNKISYIPSDLTENKTNLQTL